MSSRDDNQSSSSSPDVTEPRGSHLSSRGRGRRTSSRGRGRENGYSRPKTKLDDEMDTVFKFINVNIVFYNIIYF
jgi:hypothetical protein